MLGLVEHAKAYELLAVRAALSGDRTVALNALMTNPLVAERQDSTTIYSGIGIVESDRARWVVTTTRGKRIVRGFTAD